MMKYLKETNYIGQWFIVGIFFLIGSLLLDKDNIHAFWSILIGFCIAITIILEESKTLLNIQEPLMYSLIGGLLAVIISWIPQIAYVDNIAEYLIFVILITFYILFIWYTCKIK